MHRLLSMDPQDHSLLSSLNTSISIAAALLYQSNCKVVQRRNQDNEMALMIFIHVKGMQRGVCPALSLDIENGCSNLPWNVSLGIPFVVRAENIASSPMAVKEGVPSKGKWCQNLRSNKDI